MPEELLLSGHSEVANFLVTSRGVDELLASPGSPFETTRENVLGVEMAVFAQRKRNLGELMDDSLEHGDSDFLVFEDEQRVSFEQCFHLVNAVAASLEADYGISHGDRVAICGANSLGWVLVSLACARLGVVVVALNSWWSADELGAALELTEPALVVADSRRRELLAALQTQVPVIEAEGVAGCLAESRRSPLPRMVAEDDAWILAFTSGTSGRPKAAVLTHRSFIGFVQLNAYIGARGVLLSGRAPNGAVLPKPVRLAVFPLFHISGLGSLISALAFGHKTVWPAGRFDAGRVIELTRKEGITMWGGASTHVVRLLEHPSLDELDVRQISQVGIGGSASTPSLIQRTEARLPHLKDTFSSGYGMTECGGLASYASNILLRSAADCVGSPLPTVEIKILAPDDTEMPEGQVGAICIRSPILMTEYWRNPKANSSALLPDRWLRTEDFGRLEEGLLFVASRIRDLIIRGGENVYPSEIENRLDDHPQVLESAVYGIDDDEFGQVVAATVVVQRDTATSEAELQEHCAVALAYYKVPVSITVRTEPLPRNATGKILKALIADGNEERTPVDPG